MVKISPIVSFFFLADQNHSSSTKKMFIWEKIIGVKVERRMYKQEDKYA
jgi:hypothetical protein